MLKRFKSIAIILGLLMYMYYLCGCGRTENMDESSVSNETEVETEKKQNESEENVSTSMEDGEFLESSSLRATDYLQDILYISKEWQSGKFIVVGIDQSGNKCCGVLDGGGFLEIFEEYTGLYPLDGGKLLATQDMNAPLCLQTFEGTALNESTVLQGKIIEESEKVIYEPEDKYARMTIVNSRNVMVFSAKSGLEGINLNISVVDNEGNLINECLPALENFLLDKVRFTAEGLEWEFKNSIVLKGEGKMVACIPVIYRGSDKWPGENNIIQFSAKQNGGNTVHIDTGSYIYHTNLEDTIKMSTIGQIYELNENELCEWGVIIPESIFYGAAIYDINTGISRIMEGSQHYGYVGSFLEKDGIHSYFRDSQNGNLIKDENVIEFSNLDRRIKDYNGRFWGKKGEQFIYTLYGADGGYYLTVLDSNGSILFEPVRMKMLEQQFQEKYIICLDEENNIYMVDLDNGAVELKYEMPQNIGMDAGKVVVLNDTMFAIGWTGDYGKSYHYNVYLYENGKVKCIF